MNSSILRTPCTALVATTSPNGLFASTPGRNRKEINVRKLGLSKAACLVLVFFASTAVLSSAQTNFNSLLSFNGDNGANPHFVTLVQGEDGQLYGTTLVSTGSGGTVFKVTTGGTLTTLYTFCQGGEPCKYGAQPNAGLARMAMEIFTGRP